MTLDKKILVIGLGVIGGDYAAALTDQGYSVGCITKEQKDIDYAMERCLIVLSKNSRKCNKTKILYRNVQKKGRLNNGTQSHILQKTPYPNGDKETISYIKRACRAKAESA